MPGRKTMRHSEEWWEMVAPPTAVRCEGHVQDGSRCLREAILGATVCGQHGGSAPQVRTRAAARIGNAADDMVKGLLAMFNDPNIEPRDKIKIATDVLDRAGLNAVDKHIVAVQVDPVEALFRNILNDPNGLALAESVPATPSPEMQAYNLAALERAEDGGDVVDAVLVEEDELEVISATPPAHIRKALDRLI